MDELSRQVIDDLNFLGVLGVRDQELLSSEGDFNLVDTCRLVHAGDKRSAFKLMLAIQLKWFNGESLETKKLNQVFNALLHIATHPRSFKEVLYGYELHELYDHLNFTSYQMYMLYGPYIHTSDDDYGYNDDCDSYYHYDD